jgi:hypothetical protein
LKQVLAGDLDPRKKKVIARANNPHYSAAPTRPPFGSLRRTRFIIGMGRGLSRGAGRRA